MSTAPNGWQTPKTNWQAADIVHPSDFNRIEGNIEAIETGQRILAPSQAPSGDTGSLRQILDWFANRIRAITGATNWYDAPATTLAAAKSHIDATSGIHGATSLATPDRIIIRDSAGRAKVAAPSASDDIARKDTVDAHANATSVHGATSAATPDRIIIRDSAGRAKVAPPAANDDIARMDTIGALVKTYHKVWIPSSHFQTNDTSYQPLTGLELTIDIPRMSNVLVTVVLAKTSINAFAYQCSLRMDGGSDVGALVETGGTPSQAMPMAFQWLFKDVPAGKHVFTPLIRSLDGSGGLTVYGGGYTHTISAIVTPVF